MDKSHCEPIEQLTTSTFTFSRTLERQMSRHIAIYVRVSSKTQDTASQEAELKRWAATRDESIE